LTSIRSRRNRRDVLARELVSLTRSLLWKAHQKLATFLAFWVCFSMFASIFCFSYTERNSRELFVVSSLLASIMAVNFVIGFGWLRTLVDDADIETLFQGTLRSDIESKTRQSVVTRIPAEDVKGSKLCGICLSEYEIGESVRRLPCQHQYHTKCIDSWLSRKSRCPFCNQAL
jgi:hypothetical protein